MSDNEDDVNEKTLLRSVDGCRNIKVVNESKRSNINCTIKAWTSSANGKICDVNFIKMCHARPPTHRHRKCPRVINSEPKRTIPSNFVSLHAWEVFNNFPKTRKAESERDGRFPTVRIFDKMFQICAFVSSEKVFF